MYFYLLMNKDFIIIIIIGNQTDAKKQPLTKVVFSGHESTVTACKANVLLDRPFSQLTVSEIFKGIHYFPREQELKIIKLSHIKAHTSNGNYFP